MADNGDEKVGGVKLDLNIDGDKIRGQIESISKDAAKDAKVKAQQIAAIYKKLGIDATTASVMAWEHVDRNSKAKSKSVIKSIKNIGKQSQSTASMFSSVMGGAISKIGAMAAAAFSVGAITRFTKECLNLGSDLTEVQNVVDVTFGSMSERVNEFARNAMDTIGMSETVTKKYMGTFGSMSKAMGITGNQMYEMSETVTKMTGDVSSFYNLDSDTAYTKLKSIWTGETETLKDLGVVMTQTNLEQYALNNGLGKTYANMTQQEKLMLRYQYVMDALSDSVGDFNRTQNTWANQTRILTLRMDALKASIGQGLINLFTPILVMINKVLAGLQSIVDAFQKFTSFITGNQAGDNAAGSLASISAAAEDASDSVEGTGASASKAAKAIKRSLAGFDQITKLSDTSDSGSGGGGGGGSAAIDFGSGTGVLDVAKEKLSGIQQLWTDMQENFKNGFEIGANGANFDKAKENLENFKQSFKDMLKDPKLQAASKEFSNSLSLNLGKVFGSGKSLAVTFMENFTGGAAKWMENNKGRLAKNLAHIYGNWSDIFDSMGDFSVAFADIMEIFRSDDATSITADIMGLFSDAFMGTLELESSFASDLISTILDPITENKDTIKKAFEEILDPLADITDQMKLFSGDIWDTMQRAYDFSIKPAFEDVKEVWNDYLGSDQFSSHFEEISQALERVNTILSPVLDALRKLFGYAAGAEAEEMGKKVRFYGQGAIGILDAILTVISKVITFIANMATGAYEAGVKVGTAIRDFKKNFTATVATVQAKLNTLKTDISAFATNSINSIKGAFQGIPAWFAGIFNTVKANIQNAFSGSTIASYARNALQAIQTVFATIPDWMHSKFAEAWARVKSVFSAGGQIFVGIQEGISSGLRTTVNGLISGINAIIRVPFRNINSMLNMIRSVSVLGKMPFQKFWGVNPISIPEIPMLAQGGYIKPNTPRLALIGDNRTQGEIVSPEDKMREVVQEAIAMANGSGLTAEIVALLREILTLLRELNVDVYIDGEKATDKIVKIINRHTRQKGVCEIIF